jgi:hypothetical protein
VLKLINSGCKISEDGTHSRTCSHLRCSGLRILEPRFCLHRTHGQKTTTMKCAPQASQRLIRRAPYSMNGPKWVARREREDHGLRQKCGKPLSEAHTNHPSLLRQSHTSPRRVRKRLGLTRPSSFSGTTSRTTPFPNSRYPQSGDPSQVKSVPVDPRHIVSSPLTFGGHPRLRQ